MTAARPGSRADNAPMHTAPASASRLLAVLAVALPAGCAVDGRGPEVVGTGDLDPAIFAASSSVLSGFDPRGVAGAAGAVNGAAARAGDRVLLGIVARRGSSKLVRFLEVTLLADGPARGAEGGGDADGEPARAAGALPATITLRDEQARVLSRRLRPLPLGRGEREVYESAEVLHRRSAGRAEAVAGQVTDGPAAAPASETPSFGDSLRVAMGLSALVRIVTALSDNEVLLPMFWQTIQKPPPLAWLGRVDLEISVRPGEAVTRETVRLRPEEPRTAYRVPLRLELGRTTLLEFDIVVVEMDPPLGLCGGVVAIDARHPRRSDLSVHIRLLAARRGG